MKVVTTGSRGAAEGGFRPRYKGERVKPGYIVVPKSNNDATKDKQ